MKELELISKTTPAVVSFNYAEIDTQLDVTLKKYTGLVFTEDTVKECKKTITELKKGKKSLNDFKIKTKKLLSEDITKFEDQCKLLSDKFDTVINPISKQADEFEVTRRVNKEAEIKQIINTLTDDRFLEYKYYSQLVVTEQMLNKGPTIKAITLELTSQADLLLSQQNIEEANIELIKSKVELANAQYEITLPVAMYLRMLEYSNITEIAKLIAEDAEKTKIAAEEAKAEKLAIEARKAERADRLAAEKADYEARRVEEDRIKKERKIEVDEGLTQEFKRVLAIQQAEEFAEAERLEVLKKEEELQFKFEKECLGKVVTASPRSVEDVKATETYTVTGTEEQLDALEEFLNTNAYDWI